MKIPFNKPFLTGKEVGYIRDAVDSGKLSGNGKYTKLAQKLFQELYNFPKCLLTTSCTDALEMAAILLDIQEGDEVIMPSYTFVSTANAFVLRGAVIRFVDSREDHPGIDEDKIEELINPKTKAIVLVHYAGVACDMDKILKIAKEYELYLVEDAAHAIDAHYTTKSGERRALGSFGDLAAFSFHETKNIIAGEGGMLVINNKNFEERAEIIWEKGTNRAAFFRGEIDKYSWVDIGSSFLPSELTAAFLYAQMEKINEIQKRRISIWQKYDEELTGICESLNIQQPFIPEYAENNGHMYYLICESSNQRVSFIDFMRGKGIHCVFHYLPLHKSLFYNKRHDGRKLINAERYENQLVRMPFFYDLSKDEQDYIIESIKEFSRNG